MAATRTSPGPWDDVDPARCPSDLVAIGGRLDPEMLVAAYRCGCFPWPPSGRGESLALRAHAARLVRAGAVRDFGRPGAALPWFSPDPRAVFLPDQVHVPRSLRSTLRRSGWATTLDQAFDDVVRGCAARRRSWITAAMATAYGDLHRLGRAHSVEVWSPDGRLVGGLYGVLVGQVFSGESMFHRVTDASKAALLDTAARLRDAGVVLFDSQSPTEHLLRYGQVLMPREHYLAVLRAVRDETVVLPSESRRAADLV